MFIEPWNEDDISEDALSEAWQHYVTYGIGLQLGMIFETEGQVSANKTCDWSVSQGQGQIR